MCTDATLDLNHTLLDLLDYIDEANGRRQSIQRTGKHMANALQGIPLLVLLTIATILEASGDAVVRIGIYSHTGLPRAGLLAAGGLLLLGYGSFLNLAPVEFGRVVGLYIATLFIVWQVINFIVFRGTPSLPIAVGGTLIVAGGVLVTFWRPA
jgi:hypothetical protein